jgi:hypothetical protein
VSFLTEVDPRDTRLHQYARHHAAVLYIDQHAAMHLHEENLLQACAAELVANYGVLDAHAALAIAMGALAEVQVRTCPAWIDISLSTSLVCRVVDPVSGQVAHFTAAELIQIAQERAQRLSGMAPEDNGAVVNRCLN